LLPLDFAVQTSAILAIRGAGKTVTATVIAEEMCAHNQPWIAFDPVGVWWGLRCNSNGSPGGFPVVVFGGEHGDIPLEKASGEKIAEALMSENVWAVIDLSRESKATWRRFLTEFCLAMMNLNPSVPRHLFIEEAPEFCPQRTKVSVTAQCKEAVERVIRLGRNRGYGCTLISQRPATVDKDVLSQCENLFVLRTTGPHDRKALEEWIEAQASSAGIEKFLGELAGLHNGHAWFWSPHWLNAFEKVEIRPRRTFHPGATREAGGAARSATMSDARAFVEKLQRQLTKRHVAVAPARRPEREDETVSSEMWSAASVEICDPRDQEIRRLRTELQREQSARQDAERRLASVRTQLEPQYQSLKALFDAMPTNGSTGHDNRGIYEPWIAKAPGACKRFIEILMEGKPMTTQQLCTRAGIAYVTASRNGYWAWLKKNGVATISAGVVTLNQL
jgi:hypothetical protein